MGNSVFSVCVCDVDSLLVCVISVGLSLVNG